MEKKEIRKLISDKKKQYSEERLKEISTEIMQKLEENVIFKCSKTIMLYYSLPDEVYTHDFINKWYDKKNIVLPVISENNISLKLYRGKESMCKGAYNIEEPTGEYFTDITSLDMAIVPGIAFDLDGNRLGRGKGFYDRFLSSINTFKIGVCFDFQICKEIPTNNLDIPMDEIWTENGYINKKQYQK